MGRCHNLPRISLNQRLCINTGVGIPIAIYILDFFRNLLLVLDYSIHRFTYLEEEMLHSRFPNLFLSGRVLAIVLLFLSFGIAAFAQGAGDLTGLVTDPTGAVMPKVTITLTNNATGVSYNTETTSAGVFRFNALPITGTYTMKIEAKGFRSATIKNIAVTVGAAIAQNVTLQLGSTGETVSVEADTQLVQTTESSVSQLVDQRIWQQFPLQTRNQNDFINLVAGVTPDAQGGSTRGASVNGARGGSGNYMVEGMDNNDQGQGGRGQLNGYDSGGAVTSISPDAIQEYRVITNTFSAEYGKAGGFVTDTVLKSGTNQWHGSAFEYNRIQALAANSYFSNQNDLKDSLVRNMFGGSIGGPVVKDKLFFFFTTEYEKDRQGQPLSAISTTQQFLDFVKSGQFAAFNESNPNGACVQNFGVACPAGTLAHSKTLQPIFNSLAANQPFPLGTTDYSYTGEGLYTTGITYPVPVYGTAFVSDPFHLNQYRYTGKVDYHLSNNDSINWMMLWQHAESGDPYQGGYGTIGPASINEGVSINSGLTWNHTFTPTMLNTAKFSYLRHRSDFPAPEGTLGIPQIIPIDSMEVGFGLYAGQPQYFTDNQFQWQDSMSYVHGKHSFKWGGEYRRIRNGSSFYNDYYGTFYPWSIEDLVTDLYFSDEMERAMLPAVDRSGSVYTTSAAVDPTTSKAPTVYRGFRSNEYAFYFQDDWRMMSKLTLNYGVRYEYFGVPHNYQPNIDSNFYFGSPVTPIKTTSTNPWMPVNNPYYAQVANGNFQVRNSEIWNKDTNNFAPRLGFAYDVTGRGNLVVRGGAGIMYDRIWNNLFEKSGSTRLITRTTRPAPAPMAYRSASSALRAFTPFHLRRLPSTTSLALRRRYRTRGTWTRTWWLLTTNSSTSAWNMSSRRATCSSPNTSARWATSCRPIVISTRSTVAPWRDLVPHASTQPSELTTIARTTTRRTTTDCSNREEDLLQGIGFQFQLHVEQDDGHHERRL